MPEITTIDTLKYYFTKNKKLEILIESAYKEVKGTTTLNMSHSAESEQPSPYSYEGYSGWEKVGDAITCAVEGYETEDEGTQALLACIEAFGDGNKAQFRYTGSNGKQCEFVAAVEGNADQGETKKLATYSVTLHCIGKPVIATETSTQSILD